MTDAKLKSPQVDHLDLIDARRMVQSIGKKGGSIVVLAA
jgi:hypothetical protein